MYIKTKSFSALANQELYSVLQLRSQVFVVEQNCVYQDLDGKDQKAVHVLGFKNDTLVAYTRIFKPGDYFKEASVGRVVVSINHRKQGFAKQIMNASMDYVFSELKAQQIKLSAQTYLTQFYKDLGFVPLGQEYLEDGIPHIEMLYG